MRILLNTAMEESATGAATTDTVQATTETAVPISDAKQPTTPDEVITAAAEGVKKTEESSTTDKKDEVKEGVDDKKTEEVVDDKGKKVEGEPEVKTEELPPFHEHEAWKAKVEEVKTLDEKVKALEPYRQGIEQLTTYRKQNNITDEQFSGMLEIAALVNSGDLSQAWEKLKPIVEVVQQFNGNSLPDDLAKEVDAGTLGAERAKEIAQLRAQTKVGQAKAQVQQQTAQQQVYQNTLNAMSEWEKNKSTSDPDFRQKKDANAPDGLWEFVRDRFNAKLQTAQIGKPADAVALQEQAYAEVSAAWKRHTSAKPPTKKPLTSTGSSATAKVKIESADDVINALAAGKKLTI